MTKKFGKVLETFIDMNKDVPLGEREWVEHFHDMGFIRDALRDLVPFAQFKKREKHPTHHIFGKNV